MEDQPSDLKLIKMTNAPEGPLDIVVVARNELERLPGFFDFYEKIGVSRFWFVDNGSDDGTFEYLKAKDNVALFSTEANYGENRKGLRWSRKICDEYLDGRWVLTVDVDELLIWPGYGSCGIDQLLEYLEHHEYECLFTLMLDFFPPDGDWDSFEDSTNFLGEAPCVVHSNLRAARARHFPFIQVRGGIRSHLLAEDVKSPIIQKLPLIKWQRGRYYLKSTHYLSESTPLADITGALMHFKFSSTSHMKFSSEVARGQRWGGGAQYRAYTEAVESRDIFYSGDNIEQYHNYRDVAGCSVVRSSKKFKRFLAERGIDEVSATLFDDLEYQEFLRLWNIFARINSEQYRNFLDHSFAFDTSNVSVS